MSRRLHRALGQLRDLSPSVTTKEAGGGDRSAVGESQSVGRVAGLVGIERRGSCWPWLVCSGGAVKHGRWLGKALPAVDLA